MGLFVSEMIDQFEYDADIFFVQAIGTDGRGRFLTEQIICRYIEYFRKLDQILGRRGGDSHFPGIHTGASDADLSS